MPGEDDGEAVFDAGLGDEGVYVVSDIDELRAALGAKEERRCLDLEAGSFAGGDLKHEPSPSGRQGRLNRSPRAVRSTRPEAGWMDNERKCAS